ncbi:MAG: FAD-dependent oxidoreductase, partial [Pyrinomonadaceae bacterium]
DLLQDAFRRRALQGEPRVLIVEMGKQVVPGMGDELHAYVEDALKESRVEVHTETRVVRVTPEGFRIEHNGEQTEQQAAAVVWTAGVRVNPLVDKLDLDRDKRGMVLVEPTLQAGKRAEVFILGDIAHVPDVTQTLTGTAQLAFQESDLAISNIKAFLRGKPLKTKHFHELGEAVSLGTERAAILAEGYVIGGPLARQARFAMYTSRLPTWHHRLKVGSSWFLGGKAPRPLQPLGIQSKE